MAGVGAVNIDLSGILANAKSIGDGIHSILTGIRAAVTGKEIIDATKMAEIEAKMAEIQMKVEELQRAADNAQMEINKIEAASPSRFVSGWRPAAGWLCVTGLAWQVFIWPAWVWAAKLFAVPEPPTIDTAVLITLLFGMLGLGAYRTYERKQGVERDK